MWYTLAITLIVVHHGHGQREDHALVHSLDSMGSNSSSIAHGPETPSDATEISSDRASVVV